MSKYQVNFYESGRYSFEEQFNLLSDAQAAVREFISEWRLYRTNKKGFVKVGNLVRDNQLVIEHKAFGFEAGAYIKLSNI